MLFLVDTREQIMNGMPQVNNTHHTWDDQFLVRKRATYGTCKSKDNIQRQ